MPNRNSFEGNCQNCLIPWQDILASHPEHGVLVEDGVEYTFHRTGSGITARYCVGFNIGDKLVVFRRPSIAKWNDRLFADLERRAWETLEHAGLGDHKKDGEPLKSRALFRDIEKRGFREDIDREWFAAHTLCAITDLQEGIKNLKKQADGELWENLISAVVFSAFELGGHARVEYLRFGSIRHNTARGGRVPKSNPAILSFLLANLKKDKTMTALDLWEAIPRDEEVLVGKMKLYRNKEKLRTIKKVDGEWIDAHRPVSFSAFRRYVTSARKALSR